jgi:hypothetical protein
MSTVDRYPIKTELCPCGKGEYVVLECMPDHGYPRGDLAGECDNIFNRTKRQVDGIGNSQSRCLMQLG